MSILNRLAWLEDIPIAPWMIPEAGCLDIDNCPDCWERNAHLERYGFACEALRGSLVLDFGCGIGYGSEMLKRAGNSVVGCDSSRVAREIAWQRRTGYAMFVRPDDERARGRFHAIVAFEVLEHLEDPEAFLDDVAGRSPHLIISTPIVPTVGHNPWHKHDFTFERFRKMIDRRFEIKCEWFQIRPWRIEPSYAVLHGATR